MKNYENAIDNRYEFVLLFDVENGNPNGDPDAANMPRIDPETSHGIVTDVCLKRKIRQFIEIAMEGVTGYNILVKNDAALNTKFSEAYEAKNLPHKQRGKNPDDVKTAQAYMCENYFDVRTFGAVMSTGDDPCGIVRGPVQLNFARSIDAICPQEITITRQAKTTEDRQATGGTEMGKKSFVPYGLYRAEGYISALLAQKTTGFSDADFEALRQAIINMFEHDHSAARGKMALRGFYIFKHESVLGNAPAHVLFDKITVTKQTSDAPRAFTDYAVSIDKTMPEGVMLLDGFTMQELK